jgi:hypothetical protein
VEIGWAELRFFAVGCSASVLLTLIPLELSLPELSFWELSLPELAFLD